MKNSTTSERLKIILKQKGLKQVDLLKRCEPFCKKYNIKMGKNDLSQYISGKVQPRQDKLTILGLALNVNEAWLMGYDVNISREPLTKQEKLLDIVNNHSFSNDELDEILQFVEFIISKRK